MIKAKELRLGNWVHHKGYKEPFRQITQVLNLGEYPELDPITLTPAILDKVGFEGDDSRNDYRLGEFRVAFHIHDGVVEWAGKRIYEFIPPLHQLQNLYFALTGEELTYTP